MVSGTFELAIGQLEFEDSGLACTVELAMGQLESEDTWLAWRPDEASQSASMRFKPVGYAAAAAVRKGAELGGLGVRICASGWNSEALHLAVSKKMSRCRCWSRSVHGQHYGLLSQKPTVRTRSVV